MEIKKIDIEVLIPYANNARTHSPAQIDKIAASIKEFGFCNPVLIDKDGGIIAGHGRVLAARKMGMKEVPTIYFHDLPKTVKRNGVKDCFCTDCGTEFTVRKDTNPKVCKRCVAVRGGKAALGRVRSPRKPCKYCGALILKSKKDVFCSVECRDKELKEKRKCKTCGKEFLVLKSSIAEATNASGNFCSRGCYEKYMCHGDRITGRGSQWRKTRNKVISSFPFCAICGTTKNLQVHHITPFRLTFDNTKNNLIPLCTKHHKMGNDLCPHSSNQLAVERFIEWFKFSKPEQYAWVIENEKIQRKYSYRQAWENLQAGRLAWE